MRDTVLVEVDTYDENLTIDKELILRSNNISAPANYTINGGGDVGIGRTLWLEYHHNNSYTIRVKARFTRVHQRG